MNTLKKPLSKTQQDKKLIENINIINAKHLKSSNSLSNINDYREKQDMKPLSLNSYSNSIQRIRKFFIKIRYMMNDDLINTILSNFNYFDKMLKKNYTLKQHTKILNDFIMLLSTRENSINSYEIKQKELKLRLKQVSNVNN